MAMVDVDDSSLYRRTHSPSQVAWSEGLRPLGAVVHSSSELSQWPCGHDDSTINIVLVIIIIIIIIIIISYFSSIIAARRIAECSITYMRQQSTDC